jgi:two-component system, OmpR family, phosphate regulon sensor histidine kinase PhoR
MNSTIFRKLFFIMIGIGIVPMLLFSFLTVSSYQDLINGSISVNQSNANLLAQTQTNFNNILTQTILIFILIAIFIIFFSILLTRRFTYPIRTLIKGTEELRKGKFNSQITLNTGDEFELLAISFNGMAKNLNQKVADLERSEKATLKAFADLSGVEKNLEKEHRKTASIIANFVDPIIVIDKDDRISFINPSAKEILGFIDADLGASISKANNYSMDNFRQLIKTNYILKPVGPARQQNKNEEEVIIKKEERELTYKVVTAQVVSDKKEDMGVMKIFYDLTREKMIDKMKNEFISIAAHQLRTPLSAIKWAIKMILDGDVGKLNDEQQNLLTQGYASNERIIVLVNDMLNVSRIEEGRFGYSFTHDKFEEALDIVVKSLDNQIKKKKIKLELSLLPELPLVYMDKQKMVLVLQNILENAVKYTPESGKIEIKVMNNGDNLGVSVKDNGVGIPRADQAKLFSKFFRASNAMRLQAEGSGLGLFIVKNIIEKHGGTIICKSEEGRGTEFIFTLPLDSKEKK